jgi:hypothetical protein
MQVHERRIDDFIYEGFIIENGLSLRWLRPDLLLMRGRIRCQHGLFIDVEKYLKVKALTSGGRRVRTRTYSYNAGVEGSQDRAIFQYDNFHTYEREGHRDAHHKHRFDHRTWRRINPPDWISEEGWPHLSDAIEELREWWETTGQHLNIE